VPRSRECNSGTDLILLSVRALHAFLDSARVTCHESKKMSDCSACGLFETFRIKRFQQYLQKGKQTTGKRSNPVSRQQMCQHAHMGTAQSGKHMGIGGELEYGAGKRVMECEMCTENDEGRDSERQWHSRL
jgi:hypothetical protein